MEEELSKEEQEKINWSKNEEAKRKAERAFLQQQLRTQEVQGRIKLAENKERAAYNKGGTKVASTIGSWISKLGSSLLTKPAQMQAKVYRKPIKSSSSAAMKKRMAYLRSLRSSRRPVQRFQPQRRQMPVARNNLQRMQMRKFAMMQAQREREIIRKTTPGFYNKAAETDNAGGLVSRYKINFGQNVFSEDNPKNKKIGWRSD